jgi:hypothetical protein
MLQNSSTTNPGLPEHRASNKTNIQEQYSSINEALDPSNSDGAAAQDFSHFAFEDCIPLFETMDYYNSEYISDWQS